MVVYCFCTMLCVGCRLAVFVLVGFDGCDCLVFAFATGVWDVAVFVLLLVGFGWVCVLRFWL